MLGASTAPWKVGRRTPAASASLPPASAQRHTVVTDRQTAPHPQPPAAACSPPGPALAASAPHALALPLHLIFTAPSHAALPALPRPQVVIGHHPPRSNGDHGNNRGIISTWEPVLKKHKVQAYFAGHDHDLEHLRHAVDGTYTYDIVVTGAGSKLTGVANGVVDSVKYLDQNGARERRAGAGARSNVWWPRRHRTRPQHKHTTSPPRPPPTHHHAHTLLLQALCLPPSTTMSSSSTSSQCSRATPPPPPTPPASHAPGREHPVPTQPALAAITPFRKGSLPAGQPAVFGHPFSAMRPQQLFFVL